MYEGLVGPFMDSLMANRGRADPYARHMAYLLSLQTSEGMSWRESIVPPIRLESARQALYQGDRSPEDSLEDIHDNSWVFACRNEALVKHPITDFVQYIERRGIF